MILILTALVLTVSIETPAAWLLGYRSRDEIITVALASVITNPPLNYIIAVCAAFNLFKIDAPFVITLEAVVIAVEWRILLYALGGDSKRHFQTAFIMNTVSFLFGVWLFQPRSI
ncbi:MAG TPA: hypothetical protein PK467_11940 [Candidatus Wallbacteria bacterium]|nr:hypothetical protein [Candidatus Wallbacteria bacterium]